MLSTGIFRQKQALLHRLKFTISCCLPLFLFSAFSDLPNDRRARICILYVEMLLAISQYRQKYLNESRRCEFLSGTVTLLRQSSVVAKVNRRICVLFLYESIAETVKCMILQSVMLLIAENVMFRGSGHVTYAHHQVLHQPTWRTTYLRRKRSGMTVTALFRQTLSLSQLEHHSPVLSQCSLLHVFLFTLLIRSSLLSLCTKIECCRCFIITCD